MAELVGRRYAKALFEVADELNRLQQFKDEINSVSQIFISETKLKTIFEHPKLSKHEKKDIVNSLLQGKISQEILNLMYLIIDKGREKYIKHISKEYTTLCNEKQGIIEARAITAVPMDEIEKSELQRKLSIRFGKKVILHNTVDKSIIGGVLIRVEDKVIDSSIKGKLQMIEKSLKDIKIGVES